MKNIKIVSAMLLTAAAFASARADYFVYWQVSSSPYYTDPSAVIAYTYATIRAAEDQNYLQLYSPDAAASLETEKLAAGGEAYAGMLDKNYRGNLLVELWDANGKVAWQTYDFDQYKEARWSNDEDESVGSGGSPLTVSQVVPEPTSGLLLLFGVAGLALRRRRGGAGRGAVASRSDATPLDATPLDATPLRDDGGVVAAKGRVALVATALCLVLGGAAFGAANDARISFSTKGPDTYADGTTVLDGECYALCWSKDFANFAIKADGTAEVGAESVDGEVILVAPAKDGGAFFKVGRK